MVLPLATDQIRDVGRRRDGLLVGDDWAQDHHDIEVMDEAGRVLACRRMPEGVAGIGQPHELVSRLLPEQGKDAESAQLLVQRWSPGSATGSQRPTHASAAGRRWHTSAQTQRLTAHLRHLGEPQ